MTDIMHECPACKSLVAAFPCHHCGLPTSVIEAIATAVQRLKDEEERPIRERAQAAEAFTLLMRQTLILEIGFHPLWQKINRAHHHILDLHVPAGQLHNGHHYCNACGSGEPYEYPAHWPCRTVLAIAAAYDVTCPDILKEQA